MVEFELFSRSNQTAQTQAKTTRRQWTLLSLARSKPTQIDVRVTILEFADTLALTINPNQPSD